MAKTPPQLLTALEKASNKETPKQVRAQAVRTAAVLQLPQLDATLAELAANADEPAVLRLEALRAVILRWPMLSNANVSFLLNVLKDEEQPLQKLAAGEILGRSQLSDEQIKTVVTAVFDDALISPSVVLPALLPAKSRVHDALVAKYVEAGFRRGWRSSDEELKRLVDRFKKTASDKAETLLDLARRHAEKQKERLADYEELLKGGDAINGRAVFFGKKTACATCHRVGNDGGKVGPDLTKIGVIRAGRDLLEAIVVPSSTIAQGFDPYVFVTDDGKVLNGLIARQTADFVVVRDASGAELQLRKSKIQEMRRSTVSIMPEGLDRALSRGEFRDLLAFLQSLK
jgi:putative heme-binding domain-containing protein